MGLTIGGNFNVAASRERCKRYRLRILEISQTVSALHAAGAFSCIEMIDCAYHGVLRSGNAGANDRFILSKGHGGIGQYVVLEDIGVMPETEIKLYCKAGGKLGCHPDFGAPGIEASTGSLGHGMALAVGIAHVERAIHKRDGRIVVMLSDGELQEGSTWEAIAMAANLGAGNLIAFIDHNGFQSFGRTRETHPAFYPIKEKFEAFGWRAAQVNGHDAGAVMEALRAHDGEKPFVLIGDTVKGRGVSYMEHVPIWHYRSPNPQEYEQAVAEMQEISS